MNRKITFIAGLYHYCQDGIKHYPKKIIKEIEQSLSYNTWYKDKLVCFADSVEMAAILTSKGLRVHKIFDDAPLEIRLNAAHKMKHWMVMKAIEEFGDVLWLDWDTFNIKPIDAKFLEKCLYNNTPKFTFIPNYWATVNCSVYYAGRESLELMKKAFYQS